MIDSLLDTDWYCFTMGQFAWKNALGYARYHFTCRNPEGREILAQCLPEIQKEVNAIGKLRFTELELRYLLKQGLDVRYVNWLRDFQLNPGQIDFLLAENGLNLSVAGPWHETIFWETPLLATLSEIGMRKVMPAGEGDYHGANRLATKLDRFVSRLPKTRSDQTTPLPQIAEFGTRRRYSRQFQEDSLVTLLDRIPECMAGTSNVQLALDYGLPVIGTMAHQYLQVWQVLAQDTRHFQQEALAAWATEHPTRTIALTDLMGTCPFLQEFTRPLSLQYAGVRHDSGDPINWGRRIIHHYERYGILPKHKIAVWSDGLTLDTAQLLQGLFGRQFGKCLYGIGTSLTNDTGATPLDCVLKLVEYDGQPVVKLSDVPGKTVGDPARVRELKRICKI